VIEIFLEVRKRPVDAPLHHGRSGTTLRIAGLLEGPAALLLRVFLGLGSCGTLWRCKLFPDRGPSQPLCVDLGGPRLLPVTPTPCFTSSAKPKNGISLTGEAHECSAKRDLLVSPALLRRRICATAATLQKAPPSST